MANSTPLKSYRERLGFFVFAILIGGLSWIAHSGAAGYVESPGAYERNETANSIGQRPDKDKSHVCPHCMPPGDQELYIPLIDLPEADDGEIVLNSRSAGAMDVTPIFYKRNGQPTVCDPVHVEAGEIRYVPIKNLLPRPDRGRHDWGGFTLSFTGLPREMWSQFRFPQVNGGGSVDEFFTTKFEAHSKGFEAVWWSPEKSEAIVALGNITDKASSASITFGNGRTRTIQLAPHATELMRQESQDEGARSIKVDVIGDPGSVIPSGVITARNGSFNSAIRFYDPAGAKQPNLFANGFRLRGVTPHMVLKNTTDSSLAVLPKVIPLAGTDALVLPQVVLAPQQSAEVDLSSLLSAAENRSDLDVISIVIEDYAAPGTIIGSLYGIDRRTQQNYEAPLRDSGPIRSMAGLYPWKIADDFRTIVYITNITDEEREFVAEATYDGGKFTIAPRKLAPRETAVIDLEALRREHVKDALGHVLPGNASLGQFKWAVRGATNGRITVIGRAEMVSRSQRVSSSYSCHPDCGPNYSNDAVPMGCDITGDDPCSIVATETASYVDGQTIGPYAVYADWIVSPSSVAYTRPSGGAPILVYGNSDGSALLTGFVGIQQVWDWDGMQCIGLYDYPKFVYASISVSSHKPTLSGNHTIWWIGGYPSPNDNVPTTTTLTASPGASSYTFQITYGSERAGLGENLASTYTTSNNQVVLTSKSRSIQEEDVEVKVTANGKTSGPFYVTVRQPLYCVQNNGYPIYYQNPHWEIGFETLTEYSVLDNMNENIPDMPMNEYFYTPAIPDLTGEDWGTPDPKFTDTVESTFADRFAMGEHNIGDQFPDPYWGGSVQSSTPVLHIGQQYWAGRYTNGTGVLISQQTIVMWFDHGSQLDMVTPVP